MFTSLLLCLWLILIDINWIQLAQLQFLPLLLAYGIMGISLHWFGLNRLAYVPSIELDSIKEGSLIYIRLSELIICLALIWGLFNGLSPNDIFLIAALYLISKVTSTVVNLGLPNRRPFKRYSFKKIRQYEKELNNLKAESNRFLINKNLQQFYQSLTRALEKMFHNIELSRYKFSLMTQVLMWRTWFDGNLSENLNTARRFFSARKLNLERYKFDQIWQSTNEVRKIRNAITHEGRKFSLNIQLAQKLYQDTCDLIESIENWRKRKIV